MTATFELPAFASLVLGQFGALVLALWVIVVTRKDGIDRSLRHQKDREAEREMFKGQFDKLMVEFKESINIARADHKEDRETFEKIYQLREESYSKNIQKIIDLKAVVR